MRCRKDEIDMTNWSDQQKAIFAWFENGQGNLIVRARAGTGKTTTVMEGVSRAPDDRILLAAFNKKIATELQERLTNPASEAKTLHGVGFGFVRSYWSKIKVDSYGDRAWAISEEACGGAPDDVRKDVIKLSTKLKAILPMVGDGSTPGGTEADVDAIIEVADNFDISMDPEWVKDGFDMPFLAKAAISMLCIGESFRDGMIDFDDMIWLPVRNRWARPRYDLVVIDEAQDMNRVQIDLAQMVCKEGGRIAVVGDDRQAIYGFRGADSGSIDRLKEELGAEELGLTTTYRCGKNIVREAQRIVVDFDAHELKQPGEVSSIPREKMFDLVRPGDFILGRTNAPLVSACLKLLRMGVRANIEGRDVGKGLSAAIKAAGKGPARYDWARFSNALDAHIAKKVSGAAARGKRGEATIARLYDQHETIMALMDGLTSVDELLARIDDLFAETKGGGARVILSSVHKSKGLESDNVFLLEETFFSRAAKPPEWVSPTEEKNIEYVAITRAKNRLFWVKS